MPVLFAISVLALVALLWAVFSAARHIRRTRRRRRRELGTEAAPAMLGRIGLHVPEAAELKIFNIEEVTPYREAAVSRPEPVLSAVAPKEQPAPTPVRRTPIVVPEAPYVPAPAYVPKLTFARVSPYVSVTEPLSARPLERQPMGETPLPSPAKDTDVRLGGTGLFPLAPIQSAETREVHASSAAEVFALSAALAAAEEKHLPPTVADVPVPKKPSTGLRSVSGRHSIAAQSGRVERADWAYFNKDMGDLTDPYETPRNRPRIASGDSRR